MGVRRLAPSRHKSCEVILLDSQGSTEQVTLLQSAEGLMPDQRVAYLTCDRPNPTDNSRRERDAGHWDVSSEGVKRLPRGVQETKRLRQNFTRQRNAAYSNTPWNDQQGNQEQRRGAIQNRLSI